MPDDLNETLRRLASHDAPGALRGARKKRTFLLTTQGDELLCGLAVALGISKTATLELAIRELALSRPEYAEVFGGAMRGLRERLEQHAEEAAFAIEPPAE